MGRRARGPYEAEKKCAMDIAYTLGDIHLSEKGSVLKMKKEEETGRITKDTVTITDIRSQLKALQMLYKRFPRDAVVAEEETPDALAHFAKNDPSIRCWVLDPLDGSYNHSENRDSFGVVLGLRVREQFVLGVLYSPVKKTLYLGVKGEGVRKISPESPDGLEVRVSDPLNPDPKQGDIVHTSGFDPDILEMIYEKTGGVNVHVKGLASIDRATQVLDGSARAYVKNKGTIYGIGPESFVIEEAGGTFIDINHRTPTWVDRAHFIRNQRTREPGSKYILGLDSIGIAGTRRYSEKLATIINAILGRYRML